MELLDRLDAMIDERHLLKHPFYTRWAEGTLPLEALQEYARQYFAFESAMPRFLSAIHSRTADNAVRQQLLDNLWDEEHGSDNHAELWLRFAEGIGVSRDDVRSAPRNEATEALVEACTSDSPEASLAEGVAALYAYERQVPQVAGSKIAGLEAHYDVTDKRAQDSSPCMADGHRALGCGAKDARELISEDGSAAGRGRHTRARSRPGGTSSALSISRRQGRAPPGGRSRSENWTTGGRVI